jgi:small subunit ribosomal protein S1
VVKAQVLALDTEKRLIRLSMKQLVPTGVDEYLAEHKEGDIVTGRMMGISERHARVELGEGVVATCPMPEEHATQEEKRTAPTLSSSAKPDLSSLGSMLEARWKSGAPTGETEPEAMRAGQIRKFRIAKLDQATKKIELELE